MRVAHPAHKVTQLGEYSGSPFAQTYVNNALDTSVDVRSDAILNSGPVLDTHQRPTTVTLTDVSYTNYRILQIILRKIFTKTNISIDHLGSTKFMGRHKIAKERTGVVWKDLVPIRL